MNRSLRQKCAVGILAGFAATTVTSAQAQDFLSALFGGFGGNSAPVAAPAPASTPLPYASRDEEFRRAPVRSSYGVSKVTFCVRTCDGRYFPLPATSGENHAAACNSFCPASETKVVSGSSIDDAATENGKSYADLPNAFRYRNELVAGCTCNGKDPGGLAAVDINNDKTLRKGDIVAGPNGLVVANGRADKRTAANFTPAPRSIRAKFESLPVVASE